MTRKISLNVNGEMISLDYFVQAFVDHTVSGMLESLENTEPIKDLNLTVDGDQVTVVLNGKTVSTNEFVNKIMKSTLFGIVYPLKGVKISEIKDVKTLEIEISR